MAPSPGPRGGAAADAVTIHHGENLILLRGLPEDSFALVSIDPPFATGRRRVERRLRAVPDETGPRGFRGRRYRRVPASEPVGREDAGIDLPSLLRPRLTEALRVLRPDGSLFFHLDPPDLAPRPPSARRAARSGEL